MRKLTFIRGVLPTHQNIKVDTIMENMTTPISAECHEWLQYNIAQGCSAEDILAEMTNAGMNIDHAQHAFSQALHLQNNISNPGWTACSQAFLKSRLVNVNVIDLGDTFANLVVRLQRPDMAFYENVLSTEECDKLINLSQNKMERSKVLNNLTGEIQIIETRTSSTSVFDSDLDPFIRKIETRLSKLTSWPVKNSEKLQVLNYQVDSGFIQHHDFFVESQLSKTTTTLQGGQRIATILIYLNDVKDGGGTHFPQVGLTIAPRKGCALYFAYAKPNGEVDTLSLHEGLPVKCGEKWVAVVSLRENENQYRKLENEDESSELKDLQFT